MMRPVLVALVLLAAGPALAQSPIKDLLSRRGQGELIASDGPSYRAIVGGAEVLRLQVAGDGRATLTVDKAGKTEARAVTNRQLDALDAALEDSGFNGERPLYVADCKPEAEIVFESLIDGKYRYGVQCAGGALDKAVAVLKAP